MKKEKIEKLEKEVNSLKEKLNTILDLLFTESVKENDRFNELERKIEKLKNNE